MEKELLKQKQQLAKLMAVAETPEELDELLLLMKELRLVFKKEGVKFGEERRNNGIYNK